MARNKITIWLHRIGYVTTAIVAAELVGLGVLCVGLWNADRKYLAYSLEQTRTHQGPLIAQDIRFRPDEFDLLATIPPLNARSLRFVATPALRDTWFAFAISVPPNGDQAKGILKLFAHPDGQQEALRIKRVVDFSMPKPAADRLLLDIDRMTDGWKGDRLGCIDGTGVAFELSISGKVTSGRGNSACSDHYGAVSLRIQKSISQLASDDGRPIGKDWRPIS